MLAIIYAYKRASLVQRNALQIIKLNNDFKRKHGFEVFSEVFLFHDGLRSKEDFEGRNLHEKTLATCLSLEQEFSKIKTVKFENNINLTPNFFRIFAFLEDKMSKAIVIEEDKVLKLEGVEFLYENHKSMDSRTLIDTLPRSNHVAKGQEKYATLHTDGGNLMFGSELIENARQIWSVKDKFTKEFEKNLFFYLGSFLGGYSLKRAFNYYSSHLSWGLFNPDRPDSLFAYTLVLTKQLKICPPLRLSYDWSDQSALGMNVNQIPKNRDRICDCKPINIWNFNVCIRCEKRHLRERVAITRFSQARAYLNYKLNK